MPSRKAEQIVKTLRDEILSGKRAKGSRLPTYDALVEEFQVTRPTIARVVALLREEGLVTDKGDRSLFVADQFPHHNRYLWITSEEPGSREWTGFLSTLLSVIEHEETGITGTVVPLTGVDGRANNPSYQLLCEVLDQGSAAGLLLMNSATVYLLPALQDPGMPRVAISAPLPHAGLLQLDFDGLIDRACRRVVEKGQRIAVVSPHANNLVATEQRLHALGVQRERLWPLHVGPIGSEHVTELLFDRKERPDALFITDDNLIEPMLAGLERAKMRPGQDVYVLAHCNWPRPYGLDSGVEHIGFDVREVLVTCKNLIDAQRAGEAMPVAKVPPRFLAELTLPMPDRTSTI
jgi:DNA-binding LacI/PurR family transcriptional regulator